MDCQSENLQNRLEGLPQFFIQKFMQKEPKRR